MEDLTFLAEDETGDGIPLGVHTVSIMSLVSCGDSEVGDVMRHMQAATSGAQAIKPLPSQGSFSKSPTLPFATLWV